MRVVVDENMPAIETLLGDRAVVQRLPGREIGRRQLLGADALLVRSVTKVTSELLAGTPVKFVGTATAGTDHIDLPWLREAGIEFASSPGANANSVVEYVLSAIAEVDDFLERLLAGAVLGIVGYGRVGRRLAERLEQMGVAYRVYDPWLEDSAVPHCSSLGEVLKSDVICLHPELTHRQPWPSFHLLNAERLATLEENQLLINASRGSIVDNQALLSRLRSAAAPRVVLDVWEHEPQIDARLLSTVRLGTAHIAGYSLDSKLLASRMVCDALATHCGLSLAGEPAIAALPPLELERPVAAADAARQLLRASYTIGDDDTRLRQATTGLEPAVAAANFDRLRKQYAQRRELAGRTVLQTPAAEPFQALIEALGCQFGTGES